MIGRRIGAICSTLVVPGAGHLAYGRAARGCVFFGLTVAGIMIWPYAGMWALLLAFVPYLAALIDSIIVKPPPDGPPRWGWVVPLLVVAAVVELVAHGLIKAYWTQVFKVASLSMTPTLLEGDHFLVKKVHGKLKRGDVVVTGLPDSGDDVHVKRVVGLPGDVVETTEKQILLNGKPITRVKLGPCRKFLAESNVPPTQVGPCVMYRETLGNRSYRVISDPFASAFEHKPMRIPAGHVYVLGDGRSWSADSRILGPVPISKVVGKVAFVWLSENREGIRWSRMGMWVR